MLVWLADITRADLDVDSFHNKLKCGFCFVMIFHDYQVHIRRTCRKTDNMPIS